MRRTNPQGALCVILAILGLAASPCLAADRCEMLLDINPSSASSSAMNLVEFGNKVYFTADNGTHGTELWETNGTLGGTQMVADLFAGPDSSNPGSLTVCGNYLYYVIEGADTDPRAGLFALNGVTGTTEKICSSAQNLIAGQTRLFFQGPAKSVSHLCATDGTAASLEETSFAISDITGSLTIGNTLYYVFYSNAYGLWRTDGTDAGTQKISNVYPGDKPANLGGILLYSGWDPATDQELWRSDGTEGGTFLVKDIRPGSQGSYVMRLKVAGNRLFFMANDGTHGMELWKSDGTSDGTVLVRDINPGSASCRIGFLAAYSPFLPDPIGETVGSQLFFLVWVDDTHPELWKSDETEAGTVKVKGFTFSPNVPQGYTIRSVDFNGVLYFTMSCPDTGVELWKSDGTEAGTRIVCDIVPGPDSSLPDSLTVLGDKLIFTAEDGTFGRELWVVAPIPERRTGTAEPWRMYR